MQMHSSVFRRGLNLSFPCGLLEQIQYSKYSVREFSKEIQSSNENKEQKKKSSKYLYTIPPWMKKNSTEKTEDFSDKLVEKNKVIKGNKDDKKIAPKNDQINRHKNLYKLNLGKKKSIKDIRTLFMGEMMKATLKEDSATSLLVRKDKKQLETSAKEGSQNTHSQEVATKSKLNTKSASNTNKLNEVISQPNISLNQKTCSTDKSSDKKCDQRPRSSTSGKIHSLLTNKEKKIKSTIKSAGQELVLSNVFPNLGGNEKVQSEQRKTSGVNNVVKNLGIKQQDIKEMSEKLKSGPKLVIMTENELKTLKTNTNNQLHIKSSSEVKVNQGKTKQSKNIIKKESEPIFDLDFIYSKDARPNEQLDMKHNFIKIENKNLEKKIKQTKSKTEELDPPKTISVTKPKPKKTKFQENKEQVILKLKSNPVKLNSKETLYVNKDMEKNVGKEIRAKRQETKKPKPKMEISNNMRNKSQNKFIELDHNKGVNNVYSSKKVKIENNLRKKRNTILSAPATNLNKHLKKFTVQKAIQQNEASKQNTSLKTKQKLMKLNQGNKGIITTNVKSSKTVSLLKKLDEIHKPTKLENLNSTGWVAVAKPSERNIQFDTQLNWYKSIENRVTPKPQGKSKTQSKIIKKPIFVSSKPILKANPYNSRKIAYTNFNYKKQRPIFGPPCDNQNNHDSNNDDEPPDNSDQKNVSASICVVNTDTCLPCDQNSVQKSLVDNNTYRKPECPDSLKNYHLMIKLYQFINNCKQFLINFYKKIITCERSNSFYNSQNDENNRNKPSDNLNISLLFTNKQKQPIYICDICSYLLKYPNMYQKLNEKLKNFSHLIKSKPIPLKNQINNTITGVSPISMSSINTSSSDNNLKIDCIKKKQIIKGYKKNNNNRCPKQSYSEILNNLLETHLQHRTKC